MSENITGLPSGLVTFLFSDIEGSTRLLHRLGDAYVGVLERERAIVREACEGHEGRVISEHGDSTFAAFSSVDDAVAAAAEIQLDLSETEWPEGSSLRVRIGVHTGMAWPKDGNYIALAVHQASRVMAAAHGGQTLVSEHSMAELGHDARTALEPLGRYRLRDFEEPVELHQIAAAGESPAVRALPADRHNIVRRPTETVGRESIIEDVSSQIGPGSLITLTGPGGVGKTRIAAEVGTRIASEWDDGVWMVDLAPVASDGLVAPAIAEALGAPRRPEGDRWADVVEHLRTRHAVIVLDNCEHVLGSCRRLIGETLSRYPRIAVLATSREPIRVAGEVLRPVDPLQLPEAGASTAEIASAPAVRLFTDRAVTVRPGFVVDDATAQVVAAICRHLDGLPLFIELAAANVAVQSVTDILVGLTDSLRFLSGRDPSLPERHRTLEGVLRWSDRLLDDAERLAFRRLSLFASGFGLDAAIAALGDDGDPRLVWSLVDRSLVTVDLTANDTRYRLLQTVRSYVRSRLDETGETGEVAVRLALHYLDRFGPWLPAGIDWVGGVAVEIDNLRALVRSIPPDHEELAQQLAYTIGRYHDAAHAFEEGIDELTGFVDDLREPTETRSSLMAMLAYLHLRTGDVEAARHLVRSAEDSRDAWGSPPWDDVGVERTEGEVARRDGDLDAAVDIARTALERDLSDRGRSRMLNLLGTSSGALGDLDTAYEACLAELELNRSLGYDEYVATAYGNLAEVALRRGDLAAAAGHQRACLDLAGAQGSKPMMAFSMLVAARLAASARQWSTAMRLQERADALLTEIGLVLYDDDRAQVVRVADDARAALGGPTVAEAVAAGRAMPLADAVRLADEVLAAAASGRDL